MSREFLKYSKSFLILAKIFCTFFYVRYEKLLDKTIKRGDLLAQIYQNLTVFNDQASSLERWLGEALEIVPEASSNKIEDLVAQKDTLKNTLDQVVQDGKALINHKDVTDTANLRDRIKVASLVHAR